MNDGRSADDRERQIEASWLTNAEGWVRAVRDDGIESRRVATDRAILDAVASRNPASVLDVGCGEGWLSHRLAATGIEVVGFDSSPSLVRSAQSGAGRFLRLSYAGFAADPARVGSGFDVVVCNFSLLGREIGPVLRACAAVLRPDGCVVIQTLHPDADPLGTRAEGWRLEDFRAMDADMPTPMPWYYRTRAGWASELEAAGLAIESTREPAHPATDRPLSLLIVATRP